MGYLYNQTCYETQKNAEDAFFGSQTPNFYQSSGKNYFVSFEKDPISTNWQIKTYEIRSNGTNALISTNPVTPFMFAQCDTMQGFNDGMALGALMIPVLIAVVSFGLFKKVAR